MGILSFEIDQKSGNFVAKYGVKEIKRVAKFNEHKRNNGLDKNENLYKGSNFIKFKRIMARLEAQLTKDERERKEKKHGKGNDR